jgi:hypothetical protein
MLIPRIELGTFSLQVRCTTTMQNELAATSRYTNYIKASTETKHSHLCTNKSQKSRTEHFLPSTECNKALRSERPLRGKVRAAEASSAAMFSTAKHRTVEQRGAHSLQQILWKLNVEVNHVRSKTTRQLSDPKPARRTHKTHKLRMTMSNDDMVQLLLIEKARPTHSYLRADSPTTTSSCARYEMVLIIICKKPARTAQACSKS